MSKPNPKRAAKSSTRKTRDAENDESADRSQSRSAVPPTASKALKPSDADAAKDETASGSGGGGDGNDGKTDGDASTTPTDKPKPPSAGTTLRDASQKLLNITVRQEWNSIEAMLKQMEKIVAANGEAYNNPLTGVKDPVSMSLQMTKTMENKNIKN